MSDFQQNRVSATVWPWTRKPGETTPPAGLPRRARAVIQAVIMLVLAFVLRRFLNHHIMAGIVLGLAGGVLLSGLFIPALFDRIERFGRALGRWVAVGLTWLLLVPCYYIIFLPARGLLALRGADPMQRRFPTGDPTYWFPRPPVRDPRQYRKQH